MVVRFKFPAWPSNCAGKLQKIIDKHASLPDETIENLPALLADPYAIIPGQANEGHTLVVLGETTDDGHPIVASAQADPRSRGDNLLITFFARDTDGAGRITRAFNKAINAGTRVYVREGYTGASSLQKAIEAFLVNSPLAATSPGKARRLVVDETKIGKSYEQSYNEGPRGRILFDNARPVRIELFQSRNLSTLLHKLSHQWREELRQDAQSPDAPEQIKADWQAVQGWFSANGHPIVDGVIPVEAHEMWARGGERYLVEGKAPSSALQRLFETFRGWLLSICKTVDALRAPITPEIREVFDRLLATDEEIAAMAEQQALLPMFKDAARSHHASLRYRRDRQRQLAPRKPRPTSTDPHHARGGPFARRQGGPIGRRLTPVTTHQTPGLIGQPPVEMRKPDRFRRCSIRACLCKRDGLITPWAIHPAALPQSGPFGFATDR